MQISLLPFLFAFSIKLTLSNPVRDDPNLETNDAMLIGNPVNLDIFKGPDNQPPPDTDYSLSTSQLLAAKLNPDTPALGPVENSVPTPQQTYGDPSANLGTNKFPPVLPPSQQLAGNNPPDTNFYSRLVSPSLGFISPTAPLRIGPECTPPSELYCCYGEEFYVLGRQFVSACFSCNNPSPSPSASLNIIFRELIAVEGRH